MFSRKNLKVMLAALTVTIFSVAFLLTTSPTSAIAMSDDNSKVAISQTQYTDNSVTPENYKDALAEYKQKKPNSFNESNPSSILTDFMNEYNLDYITVSN